MVDEYGGGVDVVEGEEDGGELVAALGGDFDFLDGDDAELWLNLVITTHVVVYVGRRAILTFARFFLRMLELFLGDL